VLEPARRCAEDGFAASPLLALATSLVAHVPGADDFLPPGGLQAGQRVRRPAVARALASIAAGGRSAFYEGAFGAALVGLGGGLYTETDLATPQADWVTPIGVDAWDHRIWTVPPPSQGYLAPSAAWIAEGLPLPDDPADPAWAHLLVEAARQAGFDRPAVLHDAADGAALLAPERLLPRRHAIDPDRRRAPAAPASPGGTIYLCATDGDGIGVSLIQSNAADWGCHVVVPGTGIFLHNRGIGFSLAEGHPAELAPGRRPPHTLSPLLVTHADGGLAAVLGTMGGDSQPQVLLQLLARLLHHDQSPGRALSAPRWTLARDGTGFDTWAAEGPDRVALEEGSPAAWAEGLTARGHRVEQLPRGANVGHAHVIRALPSGTYAGASDGRAVSGAAVGA
jgi:gamma-glutamyltranspeptidase/glutathione hydrolase